MRRGLKHPTHGARSARGRAARAAPYEKGTETMAADYEPRGSTRRARGPL